ncbi:hypothetical protein [Hydrogenophaga sp. OTU3427]|uniref:hypothetical protein n=1 Tax=Hydrogenophaga sp. OTU3427 TaxID=3043856 RepID=UPI00313E33AC
MNPNYSYTAGLDATWTVLAVMGSGLFIVGAARLVWSARLIHRLSLKTFSFFGLAAATLAVTFAFFPLVYCTLNLAEQPFFSAAFWRSELATGAFALRISSYVLSFQVSRSIYRFITRKRELARIRTQRGLKEHEIANFTVNLKPAEAKLWLSGDLALVSSAQFAFYLSTLAALWLCVIDGKPSIAVAAASWCLLFISDDWSIVSDYTDHYQTVGLKSHMYKVHAFNLALAVLTPVALFATSDLMLALALFLVMLVTLAIVLLIPVRSEALQTHR